MHIEIDDLSRPQVHALLQEHLDDMYAWSPPESVHALDLDRLRGPAITFWTAWEGPLLLGSAALKDLGKGGYVGVTGPIVFDAERQRIDPPYAKLKYDGKVVPR